MKQIVVLSGKGGTGKTSLTAAFAKIAGDSVVLADCDVDASNLHLLLETKRGFGNPFYSGEEPIVDIGKCKRCGICVEQCRYQAMQLVDGLLQIDPVRCEGCGLCSYICPWDAVKMHERLAGDWFISETKTGSPLVHARLAAAGEHSGKLVAKVKEEAAKQADKNGKKMMLVDGPPGTGCPVISSISGADYVILVTEPTESGLHDLQRISKLVQNFRISMGCIINKADLHPANCGKIGKYLESEKIANIGKLNFNRTFVDAMVQGKSIVEYEEANPVADGAAALIREFWNNIEQIVLS